LIRPPAVEDQLMDADVFWEDRLVGHLRDIMIDQPYYRAAWSSAGDQEFEKQEMQQSISPSGLGQGTKSKRFDGWSCRCMSES
jgi:hypothetical protein